MRRHTVDQEVSYRLSGFVLGIGVLLALALGATAGWMAAFVAGWMVWDVIAVIRAARYEARSRRAARYLADLRKDGRL